MIQNPTRRAPHVSSPVVQHHAPNAALLIDFDNVTMGIRSDLGKELKSLLNSDVIRGKVAVQRAYADWRRYPQYIVPLAESSIDLIFAPAYGSSKKNATDLRMAIDAIELVFTRPEIGTYILMTGDSDFSSCVLKLKEYGKYVIGVGMRESSSDLLIQNCDEYYSYHALSGLTRADEVTESKEDPWTLVKRAAQQMVANGDVMRTDRLKQVMLDLDPSFDEKKIGYSKFSRFVHEAANKKLIHLRKGENGQYEIVIDTAGVAAPAEERAEPRRESGDGRRDRDRDRGRGRGRDRDRDRDRADSREPRAERAPAPEPIEAAPAAPSAPAEEATRAPAPAEVPAAAAPVAIDGLDAAYGLLQEAVRQLTTGNGKSVRDGDVKRKMVELVPAFDESELGFSKFTRFLRQAHDAEVIDLQRVNGGNYEVSLPASGKRFRVPDLRAAAAAPAAQTPAAAATTEAPAAEAAPRAATAELEAPAPQARAEEAPRARVGALRGRRGGRAEGPPPLLPGQVIQPSPVAELEPPRPTEAPAAPAAEQATAEEKEAGEGRSRRGRGRGRGRGKAAEAESAQAAATTAPEAEPAPTEAEEAPAATEAPAAQPEQAAVTARTRRGRRGRGADEGGMPPILPGQTVSVPAAAKAAEAPAAEAPAAEAEPQGEAEETAASGEGATKKRRRSRGRGRGRKATAEAEAPTFSAEALGLPRDRDAISAYLTNSYKGTGKKTADSLLDSFGDDLFQVMEQEPDRVRELLGRRADALLDQWSADRDRRLEQNADSGADEAPDPAPEAPAAEEKPKPRSRRGGRGRGTRRKKDTAPTS